MFRPPQELTSLLDQARFSLPVSTFQMLEGILTQSFQVSEDYWNERRQALEQVERLQNERATLQSECSRYRQERNAARRERDLLRVLAQCETATVVRPYLNQMLDALITFSGAQKGIVMLFSAPGEIRSEPMELIERNCDEEDKATAREQLQLSEGIIRRALSTGSAVYTKEAITDSRFSEHASVRLLRLKTVLCSPFITPDKRALGVLYLEHRGRTNAFAPADRDVMDLAVAQISRWLSRHATLVRAAEALDHTAAFRDRYGFREIVGRSAGLAEVLKLITLSLDLDSTKPVLVHGESGTGKGLVARALHHNSRRARGAFFRFDCAVVAPEDQLQQLCGQARSETLERPSSGRLESAHGGTLYLEHIDHLSIDAQEVMLRFLQFGQIFRLHDPTPRTPDVRIIASSSGDFRHLLREQKWREDFFFRLNVFPIYVPSLRERRDDIGPLAEHFLSIHNQIGARRVVFAEDALAFLQHCELQENVRELEQRLARAYLHASDGELRAAYLMSEDSDGADGDLPPIKKMDWRQATEEFQRQLLIDVLNQTDNNLLKAAELLGISRQHISRLLHELELNKHRPIRRGRKKGSRERAF